MALGNGFLGPRFHDILEGELSTPLARGYQILPIRSEMIAVVGRVIPPVLCAVYRIILTVG